MTIVVYKCDVCNREIDVLQNKRGLEVIQRCIITQGCRGALHVENLKRDFLRGTFPEPVAGLTDWTQRRVLYNHEQVIKSTVWNVVHNLGVKPSVQVFVRPNDNSPDLVEVTPLSITTVSLNELLINFTDIQSGTAQCIARSTANIVNEQSVTTAAIQNLLLTTQSELTIATSSMLPTVSIEVQFTSAGIPHTYIVDDNPSILSPWRDTNTVFVSNKLYTTRSFNIINPIIVDGTVQSGAPVKITKFQGVNILPSEVLVLLATSPYEVHDKTLTRFMDVTALDQTLPEMFYDGLELYVPETKTSSVFPYIKVID